ncbi:hypothetical protein MEX01_28780 [Methylorubrum extorquens]|nr:hypothetical protein [Methylorubrum extorquens]GEL42287.1 hypothetical protein MEX01_28780 [Methylorubrum extorquens]
MTRRCLCLRAILGAVGLSAGAYTLALACVGVWQTARRGDLITMPWSASR